MLLLTLLYIYDLLTFILGSKNAFCLNFLTLLKCCWEKNKWVLDVAGQETSSERNVSPWDWPYGACSGKTFPHKTNCSLKHNDRLALQKKKKKNEWKAIIYARWNHRAHCMSCLKSSLIEIHCVRKTSLQINIPWHLVWTFRDWDDIHWFVSVLGGYIEYELQGVRGEYYL